jgi:hypothetical protein
VARNFQQLRAHMIRRAVEAQHLFDALQHRRFGEAGGHRRFILARAIFLLLGGGGHHHAFAGFRPVARYDDRLASQRLAYHLHGVAHVGRVEGSKAHDILSKNRTRLTVIGTRNQAPSTHGRVPGTAYSSS